MYNVQIIEKIKNIQDQKDRSLINQNIKNLIKGEVIVKYIKAQRLR